MSPSFPIDVALVRRLLASGCLPATAALGALRPGLRILMYHRIADLHAHDQLAVAPARFERQMKALVRQARVVSLGEGLEMLSTPAMDSQAVAVTFDDGYLDNLVHALPIIERYRVPATIFVTSEFCDQARTHPRYAATSARMHLNWQEVRALAANPLITIGSHTLTHPHLPRLSEQQARREIAASRRAIADRLGMPVDFFCYPSGDFGPREAELAGEAGYRAALSVAPGLNTPGCDRFGLRRTEINDKDDPFDLWLKLRGAFDPIHSLLHRRRRRQFATAYPRSSSDQPV